MKNFILFTLLSAISLGLFAQSEIPLDEILGQENHAKKLDALTKAKETLNEAEIKHLGINSKPVRYELLEKAQEYIFITVPYWFSDEEGMQFYNKLKDVLKKKPHLDVKVLTDWTSPASTSDFFANGFYKKLKKLLGKENVIQWNKFWNFRPFTLKIGKNRIHDKIFVVDGRHVLAGGMNIGNDYLMGGRTKKGWHDTDIIISGPAAQEGTKIFLKPFLFQHYMDGYVGNPFPWQRRFQIKVMQNLFYRDIEKTRWPTLWFGLKRTFKVPYRKYLESERYFPKLAESGDVPIRMIYDNPLVDRKVVKKKRRRRKIVAYSKFTDTLEYVAPLAKKSLRLFIPYLTISKRMMKFLTKTAKKIEVEIITNSIISHDLGKFNYQAALPAIKQLVEGGVNVYEWQGHSKLEKIEKDNKCEITNYWPGHTIHTKAAIFDGEVAFLGSHNMNVRSEKLNSELMVMIRDKELAKELYDIFEYDLDKGLVRTLDCGDKKLTERPKRTKKVTKEYLEKTVKGLKYKLLPLLYPVM